MTYELGYRPEIIEDLAQAFEWYESQAAGLGERFLEDYSAILHFISHSAETPRKVIQNFRRVLMKRFPFAVWYEIHGRKAVILLVFDCRQDPEKLRRMLPLR